MRFQKIEFFGDSIIRGAVAQQKERLKLRADSTFQYLKELGFQVKNNAHIGATIKKGLQELSYRLPFFDKKTAVVLGFGGNDCDFDWEQISEHPEIEHQAKVCLPDFLDLYRKAIRKIRETGATVFACTLVPLDSENYFSYLSSGKNAKNLHRWLGDKNMLYRWHESYNRAIESLAREEKVPLIDLRSAFLQDRDYHKKLICYDGIHPTEQGYAQIDRVFRNWALSL